MTEKNDSDMGPIFVFQISEHLSESMGRQLVLSQQTDSLFSSTLLENWDQMQMNVCIRYIDGLVQDYDIFSALAMEILQSCTK